MLISIREDCPLTEAVLDVHRKAVAERVAAAAIAAAESNRQHSTSNNDIDNAGAAATVAAADTAAARGRNGATTTTEEVDAIGIFAEVNVVPAAPPANGSNNTLLLLLPGTRPTTQDTATDAGKRPDGAAAAAAHSTTAAAEATAAAHSKDIDIVLHSARSCIQTAVCIVDAAVLLRHDLLLQRIKALQKFVAQQQQRTKVAAMRHGDHARGPMALLKGKRRSDHHQQQHHHHLCAYLIVLTTALAHAGAALSFMRLQEEALAHDVPVLRAASEKGAVKLVEALAIQAQRRTLSGVTHTQQQHLGSSASSSATGRGKRKRQAYDPYAPLVMERRPGIIDEEMCRMRAIQCIPGVGKGAAHKLRKLGSLCDIALARHEELLDVLGPSKKTAKQVLFFFDDPSSHL